MLAAAAAPPKGVEVRRIEAAEPTAAQVSFFERKIRPVLVERCGGCHGAKQQQAGLRVDSRSALMRGGGRGRAVVPGHPESSLLLRAVRYQDPDLKMPPDGKLGEREITDLEAWIRAGAPWPSGRMKDEGGRLSQRMKDEGGRMKVDGVLHPSSFIPQPSKHWAFKAVRRPAPPVVRTQAWVRSPIDAFILAKLEARGLKPAPPADRRTLLRRVTFDLTGLPPTPDETDAFVNDGSADAWRTVVERLLASPHYGERWGRHWLDLARYADSNGMDENVHYGNAWRYRDYVVRSFNADKPFDRFLREQLAGDLLPAINAAARHEQLIATGFLSIGPKIISEVDDRKMEMDMVDEQLDTTGRVFMGLTLGCARCHDHKFDPVSTEDYYALAGIFKSTRTMTVMKKPRMWFEHSLASEADLAKKAEYDKRVADQKAAIAGAVARAADLLKASQPGMSLPANAEAAFPEASRAELKALRDELARLQKEPPELPSAIGVTEGDIADLPVHVRGSFLVLGKTIPRRFPTVLAARTTAPVGAKGSGRLELAEWLASRDHPLTSRVTVNRVWRWHFGRGIVSTPDNFGLLGDRPTHPELLDWLASEFVEGGWSVKALHRVIVLSNAYQMSSAHHARAARLDPENELLWRAPVRRLEAEELRDALLAVSGRLDRKVVPGQAGTLIPLKNREYFFDHTSKDMTRYDSLKRSLYLPVVRNHLYDVFQIFDFGDAAVPSGDRAATTVAPQALFMLNGSLVTDCAAALAAQLTETPDPGPAGKIRLLYRKAYGRAPTAAEESRARMLLQSFERAAGSGDAKQKPHQAWIWLSHAVLAANEFIYLR